jgi:hypothetical protein
MTPCQEKIDLLNRPRLGFEVDHDAPEHGRRSTADGWIGPY